MNKPPATTTNWISTEQASEIAEQVLPHFHFSLTSASSLSEIALVARDHLADAGLPTRQSLCLTVAHLALALWQEETHRTKAEINASL